jgi:hypothetical protein
MHHTIREYATCKEKMNVLFLLSCKIPHVNNSTVQMMELQANNFLPNCQREREQYKKNEFDLARHSSPSMYWMWMMR